MHICAQICYFHFLKIWIQQTFTVVSSKLDTWNWVVKGKFRMLSWLVFAGFFVCLYMLSCFRHVQLFAVPWTVAHQAPLSNGFSMQEYWSELPCPPPGDLPNPGIKPTSPALAGRFFLPLDPPRKPLFVSSVHCFSLFFFFLNKRIRGIYSPSKGYYKEIFIKTITNPMSHKAGMYFQKGSYQGLVHCFFTVANCKVFEGNRIFYFCVWLKILLFCVVTENKIGHCWFAIRI